METSQARKDAIFRKKLVDTFCNYGIYIIILIMIIYFSVQSTGFLSLSNAITVLQLSSTLGISVVGMFFVLITGGIDISVASNMYFSAVVGTTLLNNLGCPLILCFVGSCLSGLLIGCINGFCVSRLKIVPFITTLATYSVAKGLGLMFTNQQMLFLDAKVSFLFYQDLWYPADGLHLPCSCYPWTFCPYKNPVWPSAVCLWQQPDRCK